MNKRKLASGVSPLMAVRVAEARARGVLAVRNEADNDPKVILGKLQNAFSAFQETQNAAIEELRAGREDYVTKDKVEKINAEIGLLQQALDETVRDLAAVRVGGNDNAGASPEIAAHAEAFNRFFRKGIDAGLRDLEVKAALSTTSDPDGGYVVTPEMESAIDRVLENMSAMRRLATVRRVGAKTYKKLVTTTGAAAGWVGEEDARPETTTPKLSALEFEAKEVYANPATTQGALDDSQMDLAGWLADEVSLEFAEQEGDAFINGSLPTRPRGILSYTTVANASWSWGKIGFIVSGGAADFAATNPADAFIDLVYGLRRGYRNNATWLMNDLTTAKVRKFKDGQGNYLWQPSATAGQPASFLGYPHEADDHLPDVGTNAFPVLFGDFARGYLILDRVGIRVLRDPYTNKPYVHFYTTKRVTGGVQNFQAIKAMKIST